jgi:hypothetical protein
MFLVLGFFVFLPLDFELIVGYVRSMRAAAIISLLCLVGGKCFSQDAFLRVWSNTAFIHKKSEIFTGDVLQLKLKKHRGFVTKKVMAVTDSSFIFDPAEGGEISYSKIKFIRVYKYNYVVSGFRKLLLGLSVMTITLDVFNNIILDNPKVVDKKAVVMAAGMLAASLILRRMLFKRIRFNKHKTYQVIQMDYNHLAPAK